MKAYLFGPFIGELSWEMLRFAPYAIYLKKENPEIKIIVLTRHERFDLYGQYSNILIPLNLEEDEQECFKMKNFSLNRYHKIIDNFRFEYEKRFEIVDHFYPNIFLHRSKLKWQFPRLKMNYDFKPRNENKNIIENIQTENIIFDDTWLDLTSSGIVTSMLIDNKYVYTSISKIKNQLKESIDGLNTTYIGCIIEILKRSEMIIGSSQSVYSQLTLLLGIPLITVNEKLSEDSIGLLNPLKTEITYKRI